MDSIFSMAQAERSNYLQMLMQSVGSTYVCLWSYLPSNLSNCLIFWDGYYQGEVYQPEIQALFDEYRQGVFSLHDDRVPGHAFLTNSPCIELNELVLQRKASIHAQRQFYQEARIKTAIFMGCRSGEIELGWSRAPGTNIKNEMKNWFPEDFPLHSPPLRAVDPGRHSSSSSSVRSLSMDSPDSSSFLFNIPGTSQVAESLQDTPTLQPLIRTTTSAPLQQVMPLQPMASATAALQQALQSLQPMASTSNLFQHAMQAIPSTGIANRGQQALQALALTPESVDATMTRAIIAVLTSPPSSSSPSSTQNLPNFSQISQRATAFRSYRSGLNPTTRPPKTNLQRRSMLKRAITYYRSLNIVRREHMLVGRPKSTQLHHMISERKRREKLNENFQALRSLLPRETKRDKASVLIRTREYLNSLEAQIEDLSRRNQQLEAQLLPAKETAEEASESSTARNEPIHVQLRHVPESTSSVHRVVDLNVTVRGQSPILNIVIRILEFLKQDENVNLMSVQASQHTLESNSSSHIVLRLTIEGSEWDESAFQEAVERLVSDFAN